MALLLMQRGRDVVDVELFVSEFLEKETTKDRICNVPCWDKSTELEEAEG